MKNNLKLQLVVFENLSNREHEVLYNILSGKSTTQIAKDLNLRSNTISTVKKNIYFKLGVKCDFELYVLSFKNGIFK